MTGSRRAACGCILIIAGCLGGCAKKSGATETAAPPASAGADAAADGFSMTEADEAPSRDYAGAASFDDLQAQFEQLDADLSAQGIAAEGRALGVTSTPPEAKRVENSAQRCERICELKVAICDVSERICGLAEAHEGEQKYADACERSQARCTQATEACETCEDD